MADNSRVNRFNVSGEVSPGTGAGGTARCEGITGIARTGVGAYTLTLSDGFAAQEMGFTVTSSTHNAAGIACSWARTAADTVTVRTHLVSTGAAIDTTFSILGWFLPEGTLVTT